MVTLYRNAAAIAQLALVAAGCAGRPGDATVVHDVANIGTRTCTANVDMSTTGVNTVGTAVALINVPGNGAVSSRLPARFRAEWTDTVSANRRISAPAMVRVWSVTRNDRTYDRSESWPLECNVDESITIRLPELRLVEITSDPTGASVFTTLRRNPYRSEEVFLGTTPLRASLEFQPGMSFTAVRLEKSGYQAVQKEIRLSDVSVRVVMHPLAHRH